MVYMCGSLNMVYSYIYIYIYIQKDIKHGSNSRWVTLISSHCKALTTLLIVPITAAGYLLLVIFCSPSTSSGVITVFLRNSSSVLTGIPMSDELQPCCTFMSNRRGLLGVQPDGSWGFLVLSASSPQEPITCVAASGCALANAPHSEQALCCYKNNSFSVPPPLLDPVKDKNQPLSSLPPSRLIGSLKSYLIQILWL